MPRSCILAATFFVAPQVAAERTTDGGHVILNIEGNVHFHEVPQEGS